MESTGNEKDYGNKGLILMGVILILTFVMAKLVWDMFM